MTKSFVVAIALLTGCGTRPAPRATCGAGWSALTVDKTPEALSGVRLKDTTMIERVEIAGVAPRFANTLRRELRTKPGETVIDAPLGDDLRRLWRLGVIADASVEVNGGTVTFVVAPRTTIRSVRRVGGDGLAQARFRQLESTSFEPARIRRMTDALQRSYQRDGRLDAQVEAVQRTHPTGVDVCVALNPGPRITIAKLEFPGRKAMPKAQLLGVMYSKEHNRPGKTLDETALELDQLLITAHYWDHGYAEVTLKERTIERRGDRIVLSIPIEEGPVYRLGAVRTTYPVRVDLGVKPGELFSRTKLADARTKIQESDPTIISVVPLTKMDKAARTIDVTYEIEWRFPWDALRSWLSRSR